MNKLLKCMALAAALSIAGPAMGTMIIKFDVTGAGGAGSDVDTFDWAPGNILAEDLAAGLGLSGETFILKAQSSWAGMLLAPSPIPVFSPTATKEFTFQMSVPMLISSSTAGVTYTAGRDLSVLPSSPDNFFRIFHDPTPDANNLTGAGFGLDPGGTLILEGKVVFSTVTFTASGLPAGPTNVLDFFGTNDYPGITSINGTGGNQVVVDVTFAHAGFFRTDVTSLATDMIGNSNANLNFSQADPSGAVIGVVPDFGSDSRNDMDCHAGGTGSVLGKCDMLYQSDYSSTFSDVNIDLPEPGSLALLGLGLGALGLGAVRRRNRKA